MAKKIADPHNLVGCFIHSQGIRVKIAELTSPAKNYGTDENPDWYIEFRSLTGRLFWWKQNIDGGCLIRPEKKKVTNLEAKNKEKA